MEIYSVYNFKNQYFYYQGKKYHYLYRQKVLIINAPYPFVEKAATAQIAEEKLKKYLRKLLLKRLHKLQPEMEKLMQIPKHEIKVRIKYRAVATNYIYSQRIYYSLNSVGFSDAMLKGLIAHELCHHQAPNHGINFQNCLKKNYPEYFLYSYAIRTYVFDFKI